MSNAEQLAHDYITDMFDFDVDFGDIAEYVGDVAYGVETDQELEQLATEVAKHIRGELDMMYQRWLDADS